MLAIRIHIQEKWNQAKNTLNKPTHISSVAKTKDGKSHGKKCCFWSQKNFQLNLGASFSSKSN
jgi:hypothetical protein